MLIFELILVDLIIHGNGQVINWAANQTAGPIQDADGILKPGIIHIHAPPPANQTSETQTGFQNYNSATIKLVTILCKVHFKVVTTKRLQHSSPTSI